MLPVEGTHLVISIVELIFSINVLYYLGVVVHACHPSTQEAEARGPQVRCQLGLHSEALPKKMFYLTEKISRFFILFFSTLPI
jgi:hypothetical protein